MRLDRVRNLPFVGFGKRHRSLWFYGIVDICNNSVAEIISVSNSETCYTNASEPDLSSRLDIMSYRSDPPEPPFIGLSNKICIMKNHFFSLFYFQKVIFVKIVCGFAGNRLQTTKLQDF
jgi:hypothetical protein